MGAACYVVYMASLIWIIRGVVLACAVVIGACLRRGAGAGRSDLTFLFAVPAVDAHLHHVAPGFGAAILWVAVGSYITKSSLASDYGRNNGIFWGIFQLSNVLGNLGAYFVFKVGSAMHRTGWTAEESPLQTKHPSIPVLNAAPRRRDDALHRHHWRRRHWRHHLSPGAQAQKQSKRCGGLRDDAPFLGSAFEATKMCFLPLTTFLIPLGAFLICLNIPQSPHRSETTHLHQTFWRCRSHLCKSSRRQLVSCLRITCVCCLGS